ncbi:MAG: radical SAM protein, partial [Chloroflexi bacterium]|nr:radical SAM protein [Chloroflexota bacterium]
MAHKRGGHVAEDYPQLKNRIAYIETSRGCPYLCSFCLSALDKKVRYFDNNAMRKQIEQLVASGARRIKFVDRTFNLKPAQMRELMQWLTRFKGASFHFEVVGDILTPDMLDFLATVPEGMFQFEIGVQTTDDDTQDSIQRKQNNKK